MQLSPSPTSPALPRPWVGASLFTLLASLALPSAANSPGPTRANDLTVLHAFPDLDFGAQPGPPSQPNSKLIEQPDGSWTGTTGSGGRSAQGTVFRLNLRGEVKTLMSANRNRHGAAPPIAVPTPLSRHTAYGTMEGDYERCGSLYSTGLGQEPRVLHVFSDARDDGCWPSALTQGDDGALYGTARHYETSGPGYAGSIFKVTRDGAYSKIYLIRHEDGDYPSRLIEGQDGNLYGTMAGYGTYDYNGSVFKVTPDGQFSILGHAGIAKHPFNLVQASDGNFYGLGSRDSYFHYYTLFKMTPDGQSSEFVNLSAYGPYVSFGNLMQASDGNLYLTGDNSIYRITMAGNVSLVRTLDPLTEGSYPGPFTEGRDGYLYGRASDGPLGGGTLFKLSVGITPR